MWSIKNYRLGFDLWALGLFLLIMLPNFAWFVFPAPNDILRAESVTPQVDMIAQIFQVLMVAALCLMVNTKRDKSMGPRYQAGIVICIMLYFTGWVTYYVGIANLVTILLLCLAPCGAFLIFALARKNAAALIFAGGFTLCHLIFGIVNFIA